jgi:hypothetical protein
MIYVIIQVSAKVSLLFLYIRVFPHTKTALVSKMGVAFLGIHGLLYFLLVIFQCVPITAAFDKTVTGKCLNLTAIGFSGAAASIAEDLFILVLPVFETRNLQLGKGKKTVLFFMFSVGSFACVTSMIRLKYLAGFNTKNSFDATWDQVDIVKWSIIEEFTAVLCACLPSLRAFIVKSLHTITSTIKNTGNSENTSKLRSGSHRLDDRVDNTNLYPLKDIKRPITAGPSRGAHKEDEISIMESPLPSPEWDIENYNVIFEHPVPAKAKIPASKFAIAS